MGKPAQAGKTHDYPAQRQSYTCSRKGIGRRKKKVGNVKKSTHQTYYDKLLEKQNQTSGMFSTSVYFQGAWRYHP